MTVVPVTNSGNRSVSSGVPPCSALEAGAPSASGAHRAVVGGW